MSYTPKWFRAVSLARDIETKFDTDEHDLCIDLITQNKDIIIIALRQYAKKGTVYDIDHLLTPPTQHLTED